MRKSILIITVVLLASVIIVGVASAGGGRGRGRNAQRGPMSNRGQQQVGPLVEHLPPAVLGEMPVEVQEALLLGIKDEQNAYAFYDAVIDQFGAVRPFTNIQNAEAQHMEALEFLFDRYGLDVPEAQPLTEIPEMATRADACELAAQAEIANFGIYDQILDTVSDYPDLVQVFTNLRNASEVNHLPAFERCSY
jgi:hypothetical protein